MYDVRSASLQTRGAACGLGAAALFGISAPLAKILLGSIEPVLLAGLLYLGAAAGLWLYRLVAPPTKETRLERRDAFKLAIVVGSGGLLAPILMLLGLARVTALAGSLLLNLEAPFTILLALLVFREHVGRSGLAAIAFILGGAVVLKLQLGAIAADTVGVLLLAAACAAWALDNNLTQRLSLHDPFAIVRVKTLVAGGVNTAIGLALSHGALPGPRSVVGALLLGVVSYGASVVLDAYALRFIGAAREAAYFATAPFVGAIVALVALHESMSLMDFVAMGVMAIGVVFLLRERHAHEHTHEVMDHDHLHVHDAHHQHAHGTNDPPGEPHSHPHHHAQLTHDHPHVSDAHHRHRH